MAKPRLRVQAVIDTEAHADAIVTNIRAELTGKDIFEEHNLQRFVNDDGQFELVGEWRFNRDVDRDNLANWLKQQVRDHLIVKTWVQSVRLTSHLCTHDDADVRDCSTTELVRWERV
jgi:hypothetical protein